MPTGLPTGSFAPTGGGAGIKPVLLPPSAGRREFLILSLEGRGKCEGPISGRWCAGGDCVSKGVQGEVERHPPKGGFGPPILLALKLETPPVLHGHLAGQEVIELPTCCPPPDLPFLVDVLEVPSFSKPVYII